MKPHRTTALVVAALLAGPLTAPAASAAISQNPVASPSPADDDTVSVVTSDDRPGGSASYVAGTVQEYLTARDAQADGWAALANLYSWSYSRDKWVKVESVRAGGNGSSNTTYYNVREGRPFRVQACLTKGDRIEFCNNDHGIA